MIDADALKKLQKTSIEERIAVIEVLLQSLKADIRKDDFQADSMSRSQRPTFGFMKDTGTVLGDIVAPVLPENNWEVLQ